MSDESAIKDDVIRKMLRPPPQARGQYHDVFMEIAPDMFRRAAKSVHDLNLLVPKVDVRLVPPADALADLPDKRMVCILEHKTEPLGLIMFDAILLDALIEQQTLGEVLTAPRVDRPVTEIDRSMCEPFLNGVLAQMSKLAEDVRPGLALAGYRSLRMETDHARLELDYAEKAYEIVSVELDLGPGQKTAQAQIWMPAKVMKDRSKKSAPEPNPHLFELVADVDVPLTVSLPSVKISVRKLMGLAPDVTIPIDPALLRAADVADIRGVMHGKAHLGQLNGVRAIRLALLQATAVTQPSFAPRGSSQFEMSSLPDPAVHDPGLSASDLALDDLPHDDASAIDPSGQGEEGGPLAGLEVELPK